jgi:hypothetical protein
MRRALGLVVLAVSLFSACKKDESKPAAKVEATAAKAEAAKPTEAKGQTFGAGVKLAANTPIDQILAEPKKFAGQSVRVEGMVTDVCEMRGCWFELAGDKPGQKLRFKVTDGEMVFPPDSKGKHAIAEGVVAVRELSLEDSKAYAEEEAKEKGQPFDASKVTSPMSIVRLDGTGAVFQN